MPRTKRLALAFILTTSTVAAAAVQAAPAAGAAPVVRNLLDCRKVADNAERLACYDKAAAAMESATTNGDLVAIDREQRRAARRQAFGFTLPSLAFLDRGEKPEEANHITAAVVAASQDPYGKWILRLEDGAVWIQTEPETLGRRPHKGSVVNISKGALGGFFLTIDGQAAGKARRQS